VQWKAELRHKTCCNLLTALHTTQTLLLVLLHLYNMTAAIYENIHGMINKNGSVQKLCNSTYQ